MGGLMVVVTVVVARRLRAAKAAEVLNFWRRISARETEVVGMEEGKEEEEDIGE